MKSLTLIFKAIKYKWLFWAWLLIIIIATTIPNINTSKTLFKSEVFEFRIDYVIHFLIYFVLAFLFVNWKYQRLKSKPFLYLALTVIIGASFSFIEELHQIIIPGRTYNPVDFYYNSLGVFTGVFLTYFYRARDAKIQEK